MGRKTHLRSFYLCRHEEIEMEIVSHREDHDLAFL
jgi:hypothetical protein